MRRLDTSLQPRPSRERGRKAIRAMAYQRAMAALRERHRQEFEEAYEYHLAKLQTDNHDPEAS
jgi:hypothetical protein